MEIKISDMGGRMHNILCTASMPERGFSLTAAGGSGREPRMKKPVSGEGGRIAESADK